MREAIIDIFDKWAPMEGAELKVLLDEKSKTDIVVQVAIMAQAQRLARL